MELYQKFSIMETVIFPEWEKADKKERCRIERELGEVEGKMIIKEIKIKSLAKLNEN